MSWFLLNRNLTLLEPYDWKLSCTVLRGERGSNAPDLPGNIILRMYKQENEFEHSFRWKDTLPRFLYLMHTNCRYHHTLKWYADQLYVSPDALSAKLKKLYGKTANQLISESLIEEAKVCLLNPANSVQDVAEKLCFSDQASFSKFFKRYCGMSPGQFKKQA